MDTDKKAEPDRYAGVFYLCSSCGSGFCLSLSAFIGGPLFCLNRNRQPHNEGSALARLAGEVDSPIVQLHDAEGHGQSDAGTLGCGCGVRPKNLAAEPRRDPHTGAADADPALPAAYGALDTQLAGAPRQDFPA